MIWSQAMEAYFNGKQREMIRNNNKQRERNGTQRDVAENSWEQPENCGTTRTGNSYKNARE